MGKALDNHVEYGKYIIKLRKTNEQFVEELRENNPTIKPLEKYKGARTHIKVQCMTCGHIWEATPTNLIRGKGCPNCAKKELRNIHLKSTSTFVEEMKNLDENIEILGEYTGSHDKIMCRCITHNVIFYSNPTHLLQGKSGCKKCEGDKISSRLIKPQDDFIRDVQRINPYVEIVDKYTGAQNRIRVQCTRCFNIWTPVAGSLLSGHGCPVCNMSKGERAIAVFLDNNHISYNPQKSYSELRGVGGLPLSYDFYLPEYNLLIEYQGGYHDHTVPTQTDKEYEIQVEHDKRKKEYALTHNYNFLEIWYYDFNNIERILTDYLKNPVTTTVA